MDPDATLAELRNLVAARRAGVHTDAVGADRVAELFEALDTWIERGGFLPTAWMTTRRYTLITNDGATITYRDEVSGKFVTVPKS